LFQFCDMCIWCFACVFNFFFPPNLWYVYLMFSSINSLLFSFPTFVICFDVHRCAIIEMKTELAFLDMFIANNNWIQSLLTYSNVAIPFTIHPYARVMFLFFHSWKIDNSIVVRIICKRNMNRPTMPREIHECEINEEKNY